MKFTLTKAGLIKTPEFRVSYPFLFNKDEEGEKGRYGVCMIFNEDVDFTLVEEGIRKTTVEKWGEIPKSMDSPIRYGEEDHKNVEYQGKHYINAKGGNRAPVRVIDVYRRPITDPSEVYPGCWAVATLGFYAWYFNGKKGVSISVKTVQKTRDDKPFTNSSYVESDFDTLVEDDEDDI